MKATKRAAAAVVVAAALVATDADATVADDGGGDAGAADVDATKIVHAIVFEKIERLTPEFWADIAIAVERLHWPRLMVALCHQRIYATGDSTAQ